MMMVLVHAKAVNLAISAFEPCIRWAQIGAVDRWLQNHYVAGAGGRKAWQRLARDPRASVEAKEGWTGKLLLPGGDMDMFGRWWWC